MFLGEAFPLHPSAHLQSVERRTQTPGSRSFERQCEVNNGE